MNWSDVGKWISDNAAPGAALVGSLLTGNVPAAVAAGVALVGSATGQATPENALLSLQNDPATMIRLKELALQEAESVRKHIEAIELARLQDAQAEQAETAKVTISGDNAEDVVVRRTRPIQSSLSLCAAIAYVFHSQAPSVEILAALLALPMAYAGLRQWGKREELRALATR